MACRLFVILIVKILLTSCQFVVNALAEDLDPSEDEIQRIRFCNYSDESLYVVFYETDNQGILSPRTFYEGDQGFMPIPINGVYDDRWFYKSQFDEWMDRIIQVMVLKSSSMDKYGVEKLKETNYCDTMFIYRYSQLRDMDFCITYSGKKDN